MEILGIIFLFSFIGLIALAVIFVFISINEKIFATILFSMVGCFLIGLVLLILSSNNTNFNVLYCTKHNVQLEEPIEYNNKLLYKCPIDDKIEKILILK